MALRRKLATVGIIGEERQSKSLTWTSRVEDRIRTDVCRSAGGRV